MLTYHSQKLYAGTVGSSQHLMILKMLLVNEPSKSKILHSVMFANK